MFPLLNHARKQIIKSVHVFSVLQVFFLTRGFTYIWLLSCTYPHPIFSFLCFLSYSPFCESANILSYAVSYLHRGIRKLRRTCSNTVGHLIASVSTLRFRKKITSRSAFWCAGRGPAVNHPSTDPAPSCLTIRVIACHRIPTTYRTLSISSSGIFTRYTFYTSICHL